MSKAESLQHQVNICMASSERESDREKRSIRTKIDGKITVNRGNDQEMKGRKARNKHHESKETKIEKATKSLLLT